jgi:hypothetical protein
MSSHFCSIDNPKKVCEHNLKHPKTSKLSICYVITIRFIKFELKIVCEFMKFAAAK